MYLRIEPDGDVTLAEADVLTSLHVAGPPPGPAVVAAARAKGIDLDDDLGHAWIAPPVIAGLVAGVPGAAWSDWAGRFSAMCEYAASKGWTDDDGRLRAHTVWG